MTTALTSDPARRQRSSGPGSDCTPVLAGVRLGSGEHLYWLLDAALEMGPRHVSIAEEPAGYVLAADGWPPGRVPSDVSESLAELGYLEGRPVGLIIHAADVAHAVSSLAALRAYVIAAGGLPVDGGLCVDPVDASCDASGDLADITLHSRLALLGHHVQGLARSRLTLRAIG